MSNQFKTFIKFSFLAVVFIAIPIVADKFGKDLGLFIIPEIVFFLALVWYKVFYLGSKNKPVEMLAQNNYAPTGEVLASFSWQKQLISSIVVSFVIFVVFVYLGGFIISFLLGSFIFNFPPLIYPIRVIALVFLIYVIIRWISVIKYSIKVRGDEITRKVANKKILMLASIIGLLACIILASLGPWGLMVLLI